MKIVTSLVLLSFFFVGCQTKFYVVRHAEKAAEPQQNPPLTPAGQQRAERLKTLLVNENLEQIYASNYVRTRETARPTAEALSLPIDLYDPGNQAVFIEALKASRKHTLVVGHSNTIRHVINGLTETETLKQDLRDDEYSNLYLIKRKRFPRRQIVELRTF